MTAITKKLSVKTVFGTVNAAVITKHPNAVDGVLHVMSVMGIASGLKSGTANYGDWTAMTGMFKAINPNTGTESASGQCFLPDVAQNMLIGEVSQGRSVEFAFGIQARLDENSPVGFSYTCTPLFKQDHDPLKALEEKMSAPLALEAPKAKAGKK